MPTSSQPIENPHAGLSRRYPVSLKALFQVLTCCCIFFAVLKYSPFFALVMTLLLAPTLMRTAYVAEVRRQKGQPLDWKGRIHVFCQAMSEVLLVICAAVIVFLIVSFAFGLLGMLFGFAVAQMDFLYEAGIIGTVGGMIWGMAAGFLTIVFLLVRLWNESV